MTDSRRQHELQKAAGDRSPREQAEEALRESEERYRDNEDARRHAVP